MHHIRCSGAALVVLTAVSAWAQEPALPPLTFAATSDPLTIAAMEIGRVLGMSVPMVAGLIYLARVLGGGIKSWQPTVRVVHVMADDADALRVIAERLAREPR